MKEIDIWKYIEDKLLNKNEVFLLTIAVSSNASPGRTGFKMVIADDDTTIGTIGGGIMEFDILKEVQNFFKLNSTNSFFRKLHHSNIGDGDKSGLICGGFQTIVFKYLNKSDLDVVQLIIQNLKKGINGFLQTNKDSLIFTPQKKDEKKISFLTEDENWILKENIGILNRVYIVGGGHVGLAVSKIMATLNFFITVFDHREEVATLLRNKYADKIIITPYINIRDFIIEGNESFVIIVSPSHVGDKDALQSVLNLNLKYIGSMGSKKKIQSLFTQLRNDGFSDLDLEKIHTPVGIEIEAETVEEIAVSIAAEVIQIKNNF